jgi:hypothetical protein
MKDEINRTLVECMININPQWKTISLENILTGRQPEWKTTSIEDSLNGNVFSGLN